MDTSKEYIKMCEKAVEVQDYKKASLRYGYEEKDYYIKSVEDVWLPRQDQLQEMVAYKPIKGNILFNVSNQCDKIKNFKDESFSKGELYYSLEMLWLAFVMKDKYNKSWDGNDWN